MSRKSRRQGAVALHLPGGSGTFVAGPGAYPSTQAGNKNMFGWTPSVGSADDDLLWDLDKLRAQSRDLARGNPLASGAVDNVVLNSVGDGLKPQSRIDAKFLGLNEQQAATWQREAERLFWLAANSKNIDAERTLNFWELQGLVFRSVLESGDVVVLRRFIERKGWKFGTALQVVEADRLDTPMGRTNDPLIRSGVEIDGDGAPVAYHISKYHPGELTFRRDANTFVRVDARDAEDRQQVLHLFAKRRPGQSRGISYLAPVIEPLKQLGRYTEAEITAAVISGLFTVAIKSPAPTGLGGSMLPGAIPGQVGGVDMVPKGTTLTKLQSGAMVELAPGEELQSINPGRPNPQFDPFVQAVLKQIGAGLNQPLEVLTSHFQSSYSAARAALLMAWKFFSDRRKWLLANFNTPVWEWVLYEAVARGYLSAPGFLEDAEIRAAYCQAEWAGAPMGSIDPEKEGKAAEKWLALGATTLQAVTMENFGTDWEETLAQRKREKAVMDDAGVAQPQLTNNAPQQPQPPADGEDDDGQQPREGDA